MDWSVTLPTWKHKVSIALFSLFALFAGLPKLLALDFMVQNMASLNYGVPFTVFIGLCWVLAGIGVWFTYWRKAAVLGTFPIIAGAIAAHLTAGDPFPFPLLIPVIVGKSVLYLEGFCDYLFHNQS